MPTSEESKAGSGPQAVVRARTVTFSGPVMAVGLEEGQRHTVIVIPLERFPRLAGALNTNRAALDNWQLIGGGIGIHWPDLDEDISVQNLLADPSELLTYRDDCEAAVNGGFGRPDVLRVEESKRPTKGELESARSVVLALISHFETANQSIGQEAWIGLSLTEHFLNDLVNGMWGADKWQITSSAAESDAASQPDQD